VDLSLEGELGDHTEVNLLDLQELTERLHLVFKADICVFVHISKVLAQDGIIHRKVLNKLISELQALVKLNLELNLGCQDCSREEISKVIPKVLGVNSLNLTVGHLRD
jgi:hypothetical protein